MNIKEIEFEDEGREMAEWAIEMTRIILNRKRLGKLVGYCVDGSELDFVTSRGKKISILGHWDVLTIVVDKQIKFKQEYKKIYNNGLKFKFV